MQGEKGMVVGMSLYSQIREAYVSGESLNDLAYPDKPSRSTVKEQLCQEFVRIICVRRA